MKEVEQILSSYKVLKDKIEYIKEYFIHMTQLCDKSIEIFEFALQIPRDTTWNDKNLSNLVEVEDKQKNVLIQKKQYYNSISTEIDKLLIQINEEIKIIKEDILEINKQNESKNNELEYAKNQHNNSWVGNGDPWLTDCQLKVILRRHYSSQDSNSTRLQTMLFMHKDKFTDTQNLYIETIRKILELNNRLYTELSSFSHTKVHKEQDDQMSFHKHLENNKEIVESKIINAYEGIISSMNIGLEKKNIDVYRNIEPVHYDVCNIKQGLTGPWILAFVTVTRSKFIHFINISEIPKISHKYSKLLKNLQNKNNISLLFLESKRNLSQMDNKQFSMLLKEVRDNIEKSIDKVFLSINLNSKTLSIDKYKNTITIRDESNTGLLNWFGFYLIKIKTLSTPKCSELFISMKKSHKDKISAPLVTKQEDSSDSLKILIVDDNPWVND